MVTKPRKRRLVALVMIAVVVVFVCGWHFKKQAANDTTAVKSAAIAGSPALPLLSAQVTGQSRPQVLPVQPLKQVTFSKAELEANPKFWMLAYSEQDVAWLARFGYPTLEEESKLSQATIEQLSALAEAGNLNAKIHLGLRNAHLSLISGDSKSLTLAAVMVCQSLIEGGPYQAAKTADFL